MTGTMHQPQSQLQHTKIGARKARKGQNRKRMAPQLPDASNFVLMPDGRYAPAQTSWLTADSRYDMKQVTARPGGSRPHNVCAAVNEVVS